MKSNLAINGGAKVVPEELKVNWPVITNEDKHAVMRVLDRGVLWAISGPDGDVLAPEMHALESEFASYIGAKHCLAVNGGTSAIHMALAAAGVGPGDEVITSAFSFVATPVAILHHNAIPIFVDIHPATFNIDVAKIEEKITERTKALLPVHIHGVPADMDEIMALAKRYNLVVIEDACQAPGAVYKNKKAGNLGHMAAFSLNGTKNFAVGEGGLFVTNDQTYRDKANVIRQVGEDLPPEDGGHRYQHMVAWNYRAQEMPCAFARSQLQRLNEINAIGRGNGEYLTKHLADIKGMITPYIPEDRTSTYHKYRIRLAPEDLGLEIEPVRFREALRIALQAEGVDVVLWQTETLAEYPIFQSMQGYGKGCPWTCAQSNKEVTYSYKKEDYPETTKLVESSLVVGSELHPLYCQKRDLMVYYVEAFHKVFNKIDQVVEMAEQLDDQKVAYSSKS